VQIILTRPRADPAEAAGPTHSAEAAGPTHSADAAGPTHGRPDAVNTSPARDDSRPDDPGTHA
jgi:hypothetical protein